MAGSFFEEYNPVAVVTKIVKAVGGGSQPSTVSTTPASGKTGFFESVGSTIGNTTGNIISGATKPLIPVLILLIILAYLGIKLSRRFGV